MNHALKIETQIPVVDAILDAHKPQMGADFQGYKNHVYRMLHCCYFLHPCSDEERQKLAIAAAFHDLGIWPQNTADYLPPSLVLAKAYLQENNLQHWQEEICLIIDLHHKLRPVADPRFPLIEVFRRADLVDFSLGMVKNGVPKAYIKQLKATFPNAGFHKRLGQLALAQLLKNPLNPAPMMKW